jgi:hypothetical protein
MLVDTSQPALNMQNRLLSSMGFLKVFDWPSSEFPPVTPGEGVALIPFRKNRMIQFSTVQKIQ